MHWKRIINVWVVLANWVHFGSKVGTPKLLKNTIV